MGIETLVIELFSGQSISSAGLALYAQEDYFAAAKLGHTPGAKAPLLDCRREAQG